MSRKLTALSFAAGLMGGTALAEAPDVAVDIAPVHSLVARVMDGVGAPSLILPPGASPHGYSMRPSEAAALQDADLVVWMGAALAPWMEGAVDNLAGGAAVLTLLEADETTLFDFRDGASFEVHAHDGEEHGHDDDHVEHVEDEHGHEGEHDEHDGHEHDDHDDHDDEHDDHDEHDHGAYDPHAWLSPVNATAWLNLIAAQLSAADPDNAGTYFANAAAATAEIQALTTEVNGILDPVRGGSFVVFHDAYQYFENAFDFRASGAISLGDATSPSPARIAEIQARVRDEQADCVLAEPQYNPGLVATVLEGTEARTGVIDPLGVDLTPGAALYPQLIRNMAQTLADCL